MAARSSAVSQQTYLYRYLFCGFIISCHMIEIFHCFSCLIPRLSSLHPLSRPPPTPLDWFQALHGAMREHLRLEGQGERIGRGAIAAGQGRERLGVVPRGCPTRPASRHQEGRPVRVPGVRREPLVYPRTYEPSGEIYTHMCIIYTFVVSSVIFPCTVCNTEVNIGYICTLHIAVMCLSL